MFIPVWALILIFFGAVALGVKIVAEAMNFAFHDGVRTAQAEAERRTRS